MRDEGADLIDLGAESTRPGAASVSLEQEMARILPVATALAEQGPSLAWSIDTQKSAVARAALERGACMVNDVSALRADPAMAPLAAQSGCGLVLMHRLGEPGSSAWSTAETHDYGPQGVLEAVQAFLLGRAEDLKRQGIAQEQLWLDPGFGFGKSVGDNLSLLKNLARLIQCGYPVLLGTSRKSSLGAALGGLPVAERLEGTAATVALACWQGAACVRVHDVKEMARVVRTVQAIKEAPAL
jgi:dihydropteroate synthase